MASFWVDSRQSTHKTRYENNSVPYPYQQLDFRSDPASGVELLSKALAAGKTTRCYTTTLGEVARRQMTPEIEQEAVAHQDGPDVEVAASAVATLGRYGSAEAEQPLWDRLRKWHSAWASRPNELPDGYGPGLKNGSETGLELALIEALGTGQGWFAGPEKLGKAGEPMRLGRRVP